MTIAFLKNQKIRSISLLIAPVALAFIAMPATAVELPSQHICNELPSTAPQWRDGGYCDVVVNLSFHTGTGPAPAVAPTCKSKIWHGKSKAKGFGKGPRKGFGKGPRKGFGKISSKGFKKGPRTGR